MTSAGTEPRHAAAIERDIARTRASMNRHAEELARRLGAGPGMAGIAHPHWLAAAAIAAGAALAVAGWRHTHRTGAREIEGGSVEEVFLADALGRK